MNARRLKGTLMALAAALGLLGALPGIVGAAGALEQVASLSRQAEGLLREGKTGREARAVQQEVLDRLDEAIAALQPKVGLPPPMPTRLGETGMEAPGGATARPLRPAEESAASGGQWQYGRLRQAPAPDEAWLPGLPPAERKAIQDAFDAGRLPRHYQALLREYNKRLAEEE